MRYRPGFSSSLMLTAFVTITFATVPAIAKSDRQHCLGECYVTIIGHRAPPPHRTLPAVTIKAINLIGFATIKAGGSGTIAIDEDSITFAEGHTSAVIPISAIHVFAISHTSKPLLRGVAGTLASLAPNGAGQIYSAVRPGAELLTIFYDDDTGGLHGAVLLLPSKAKAPLIGALAERGLSAGESVAAMGERLSARSPSHFSAGAISEKGVSKAVMVNLPQTGGAPVPIEYTAAVYENLLEHVSKGRMFTRVWRQGDRRADGREMAMSLNITGFRKGNPGIRGAIPVIGMIAGKTLITATVALKDASGAVVLEQQVKGSKRMLGESMAASTSLAQRVTAALGKALGQNSPSPDAGDMDREVASR
jgi:hypothetical protein